MKFRKEHFRDMSLALRPEKVASELLAQGLTVHKDHAANVLHVEDAEQRSAKLEFQGDGAIVTTTESQRKYVSYRQGNVSRFVDPGGLTIAVDSTAQRRSTIRRGDDVKYEIELDEDGQLRQLEYPDGTYYSVEETEAGWNTVERDGGVTRYEFGRGENVAAVTDPRGKTTRFGYDENGLPDRITLPNGTVHEFEVDESGFPDAWRVNGNLHAEYVPDEDGRLTIRYADGSEVSYLMDGDNIGEATNGDSTLKLAYDDAGRLLSEDQNGKLVQYVYDKTGLLTSLITPDGDELRYERDEDGRICRIVDWDGNVTRLDEHPNGQIRKIAWFNGVTTDVETDVAGFAKNIRTTSPAVGQPLVDLAYVRDHCDRVTEEIAGREKRSFRYDAAGRLKSVIGGSPQHDERFEWDQAGNCIRNRGLAFEYDDANQLARIGAADVEHDPVGNATVVPKPYGKVGYRYNGAGWLVEATLPSGEVARYEYDPLGRRTRKIVGETVVEYTWAGYTLLGETTTGPAEFQRRDHLFLPGQFLPLAMRVDGQTYAIHTDQRMAAIAMTDASGRPVWRAEHSAFGETRLVQQDVENPWRLMNQYFDSETGLNYNVARYYDPQLGRYLTVDPLLDDGGSANYYGYANGDPINKADPTGLFLLTAIVVGAIAGAVIAGAIEAYKQSGKKGTLWEKTKAVAKKAAIGGVVGAVGGLAGGLAVMGGAAVAGVSVAALEVGAASLGTLAAIGAAEGIAGGLAEVCFEASLEGRAPTGTELAIAVLVGGGIGAVSLGVGGVMASRAARKAANETTEKASRQLAEEVIEDQWCFTGDTLVATCGGRIPIREVRVGTEIRAFDFDRGEWTCTRVLRTQTRSYRGPLIRVYAGDSEIEVTPFHPFWVVAGSSLAERPGAAQLAMGEDEGRSVEGRWIDSHDLSVGDKVQTADGVVTIAKLEQVADAEVSVCSLTADTIHSFAVGEDGLLAHNESWCKILAKGRGLDEDALAKKRSEVQKAWADEGVDSSTHGHHLVHKEGFDGVRGEINSKSQAILEEFDISLLRNKSDAASEIARDEPLHNLIIAPYKYVHGEEYVRAVHKRLSDAKEVANSLPASATREQRRQVVVDAMDKMRRDLESGKKL